MPIFFYNNIKYTVVTVFHNRDLGNLTHGSFTLYNPQSQQYQNASENGDNADYEECRLYESIDPSNGEDFEVSPCPAYQSVSHNIMLQATN